MDKVSKWAKSSMTCGIYRIVSPSGKFYIGSTNHFYKRFWEHKHALKKHRHTNRILQFAWDKYNGNLVFEPILICEEKNLLFYEQLCIENLKPKYNISLIAGSPMTGRKASEETKLKMSLVRKGKRHTQESIEKMKKILRCRNSYGQFVPSYGGTYA